MKKQISRQRLRLDKGRKWEINKRDEKTLKREGLSYSGNTESELTESCQRATKGNRVCGKLIARKQELITQTVDRSRQICNFSTFTFLLIVENRKIHFWDTKASFCRITSANAKKKKALFWNNILLEAFTLSYINGPFTLKLFKSNSWKLDFLGKLVNTEEPHSTLC